MTDMIWIEEIDHRISSGIIFFMLLLLLGNGRKKDHFFLRVLAVLTCMNLGSWSIRYLSDVILVSPVLQGMAFAAQILILHILFLAGYALCYRARPSEILYDSLLALLTYKIAWNGFKTVSSFMRMEHQAALWSTYSPVGSLVSYISYFLVSLVCCRIYRSVVKEPPYHAPQMTMSVLTGVFVFVLMILEYCGHAFTGTDSSLFLYYFCALLYTVLNFVTLLILAKLNNYRHENRTMHDFISNKMRYYEMSHEGIVSLQTKCHDLKHQIAAIRSEAGKASFEAELNSLENSINAYSAVVECGNQTIDIVLTEKNLLCLSAGVKFTYMIDGAMFSFLTEREIYSLFGNALDNALEAASGVADESRRMITLKANQRSGLVVLQVENTFEGSREITGGALPRTTKTGPGHGFGLRSIDTIARHHGGSMSVRSEGDIFKLSVAMQPA